MMHCRLIQKNLVAFLTGELRELDRQMVTEHLQSCPACRSELELFRQTISTADCLKSELDRALGSIDWEENSKRIVAAIGEEDGRQRARSTKEKFPFLWIRLKPVLAGLVVGILIGASAFWFVFRGGWVSRKSTEMFFASGEFLDRVDLEIARRETLDYLERSQFVLLELIQTKPEHGRSRLNEVALDQVRELLSKKKFLNPQLEKVQMAKAKEICDQIELLFYELASLSDGLSETERQEIQSRIEDKSLLLKIRLLKKELQKSEV